MKTKTILLFTLAILTITANVKAQNIPSYIPTNGLVGWWPFNGNANDESGNGNDGTVNGATLTEDRFGEANKAYSFNGATNSISIPHSNSIAITGNVTISVWKRSNGNTGNYETFVNKRGGNGEWNYSLGASHVFGPGGCPQEVDKYLSARRNNGGAQYELKYTDYLVSNDLNNWTNVILSINSDTVKFFINGNLVGNSCFGNIFTIPSIDVQAPLTFGSCNCGLAEWFHGTMDDIAIWNRALTQQEVTALYTASSTNNNATSNTTANVPGAISYQAVARDPQGMPLADANLQVRFTLIADSISGTAEYVETHTLSTNSLGLFTTAFGAGTPVSNTFGNINWTEGNKFVNVQIDAGNGWMDMGTQQLLSTPYSMHSATSGSIKNPGLPVFADNAAALAGGLVAGDMYRTASGDLKIVY